MSALDARAVGTEVLFQVGKVDRAAVIVAPPRVVHADGLVGGPAGELQAVTAEDEPAERRRVDGGRLSQRFLKRLLSRMRPKFGTQFVSIRLAESGVVQSREHFAERGVGLQFG